MADKVKVWFDPEGDFLEVQFGDTEPHRWRDGPPFIGYCGDGRKSLIQFPCR
jgi:hypothetical protein